MVKKLNQQGLTVVYTSHYMEEVEFLCDRVAIVDHGKVIASGTLDELRLVVGNKDTIKVAVKDVSDAAITAVGDMKGVDSVTASDGRLEILSSQGRTVLADVIGVLNDSNVTISSVEVVEPDLESVFLHLTGRSLRD
jgi:ABC-2 type transport system ATP-binding protein